MARAQDVHVAPTYFEDGFTTRTLPTRTALELFGEYQGSSSKAKERRDDDEQQQQRRKDRTRVPTTFFDTIASVAEGGGGHGESYATTRELEGQGHGHDYQQHHHAHASYDFHIPAPHRPRHHADPFIPFSQFSFTPSAPTTTSEDPSASSYFTPTAPSSTTYIPPPPPSTTPTPTSSRVPSPTHQHPRRKNLPLTPTGNTHKARSAGYVGRRYKLPPERKERGPEIEHTMERAEKAGLCVFCRWLSKNSQRQMNELVRDHPQAPKGGRVRRTGFQCKHCKVLLCKDFCIRAWHDI